MGLIQDGVISFLAAVGLTTIVWIVGGAVVHAGRPAIPGLLLVLPLRGEALAMESDVRELRRLQGRLPGSKIILEDQRRPLSRPIPGRPGTKRRTGNRKRPLKTLNRIWKEDVYGRINLPRRNRT